MKVRVINKFRDAESKEVRKPGDVFECSEQRYEQISATGAYVEKLPDNSVGDIARLSVKELKELAKERKIENYSTMSKEELVNALK